LGRFPFTKTFGNFDLEFPFGRGSRGTPGRLKDRERSGTGDKNNTDEKSVNGTQIFHWEVSTGIRGLPFEQFHFFWEPKKRFSFSPEPEFSEFLTKWKAPLNIPISLIYYRWFYP